MKIRNLDSLMEEIRGHFKEYLEMHDTEFTSTHFTCPNRSVHVREDYKPSCAFFPNPDAFKCFSCEVSGDIYTACHYLEGKPLTGQGFIMDNVLYLANLFGIKYEIEEYTPEEKQKEGLYKALEDACKISNQVIKIDNEKTKKVQDFVKERGWEDLIDIYQFGYCNYTKLIELLKKKGHSEEILKEVGLIPKAEAKGNQSKYLLNDRLLFPIKNHYGRIVGFGSRTLEDKDTVQKYMNSRNTILYNKTNILFNLDKARLNSDVYVVEGYADVFTLYKYGIKNVIALCGLSFNEARYKLLVKQGVTKIIFCLDSDAAGKQALTRIIDKDIKGCTGIDLFVKEIPNPYKDVDELLVKEGVKTFKEINELSIFDWKLSLLKNDKENDFIKNDIIKLIVLEDDYTKKEILCKRLAKVLDVSKEAVKKETEKHDLLDRGRRLITSEDIQEEDNCFERVLSDWDRSVWNRSGDLLGLDAKKFPSFIKKMDGIQNMFYILAGDTNIGKSAMLLNLALDVIESNKDVFVLFFSVDDSISQLLPRMISVDTGIPINAISNPKYKIKLKDGLSEEEKEKLLKLRGDKIEQLKAMSDRFAIKEESEAKRIEQLTKYIKIYKKISEGKQLVVFVDNLHRLSSYKKLNTRELYMMISDQLKYWKNQYDIPIITTAELRKTNAVRRPIGDDIKECVVGSTLVENAITGKVYRIDELKDISNMLIWSINKNLKLEQAQISKWLSKGKKKIIKLITSSGREIRGSANHPVLTDRGWIYLKNLKKSDMIAVVRNKPIKGKKHEPELARFLGYMAGDGCYKCALFSNKDIGVRKDIISIVKSKFGIIPSFQKNGDIRLLNRRSTKRIENPVKKFFRDLGIIKQMKANKVVPQIIFEMDNESIANFLSGYFIADGTINKNRFVFYSCSLCLLKGTQSLLLRFGIQSSIVGPYKYNKKHLPMFQLRLSGNAAQKKFSDILIPVGKKAKIGKKIKLRKDINNFDRLPVVFSDRVEKLRIEKGLDRKFMGCFYMQRKKNGNRYCMRRDTAQEINNIINDNELSKYAHSDIYWDTIRIIEKEQKQEEVFDIQVEKNHNFITAEGLVVHNTKDLQFDADFVGLLYNDYYQNPNTGLKFVRDVNAEDAYGPVVELNVIKNKTSSFKSRLYYKFYPELSKFLECNDDERKEYLEQSF